MKKGSVWIGLGFALILSAAMLAAYNLFDNFRAGSIVQDAADSLEQIILTDVQIPAVDPGPEFELEQTPINGSESRIEAAQIPIDGSEPEITSERMPIDDSGSELPFSQMQIEDAGPPMPWMDPYDYPIAVDVRREQEIPDYILNPNMEMPVSRVNGQDYIGILEIPVLKLKIPVISKWSYPRLRIAPCRYAGSVYTRDLVISAHNYAAHFGGLKRLDGGERVIFTDVDGNRFDYRVAWMETLRPRDVDEMKSGDWDLTLFTCTLGGSYRIAIRCNLI